MKMDFTNSTRPELLKLNEHFGDVKTRRGTVIEWKELETVLDMVRDDNRFHTVIAAWRKNAKNEFGVWMRGDLDEVIGVGLRVLTDEEQIKFSSARYKQAGRRIVDGHAAAANTDDDKLSPEMRKEKEHRVMAGRHLHAALIESRKFLPKTTAPPEVMPKQAQ